LWVRERFLYLLEVMLMVHLAKQLGVAAVAAALLALAVPVAAAPIA